MTKWQLQNLAVLLNLFERYYLQRDNEKMCLDAIKKARYIIMIELGKLGIHPTDYECRYKYQRDKVEQNT